MKNTHRRHYVRSDRAREAVLRLRSLMPAPTVGQLLVKYAQLATDFRDNYDEEDIAVKLSEKLVALETLLATKHGVPYEHLHAVFDDCFYA